MWTKLSQEINNKRFCSSYLEHTKLDLSACARSIWGHIKRTRIQYEWTGRYNLNKIIKHFNFIKTKVAVWSKTRTSPRHTGSFASWYWYYEITNIIKGKRYTYENGALALLVPNATSDAAARPVAPRAHAAVRLVVHQSRIAYNQRYFQ